jgi:hypothetical protein
MRRSLVFAQELCKRENRETSVCPKLQDDVMAPRLGKVGMPMKADQFQVTIDLFSNLFKATPLGVLQTKLTTSL